LELDADFRSVIKILLRSDTAKIAEFRRARIIFFYHDGVTNFSRAAKQLGYSRDTLREWYLRGKVINEVWSERVANTMKEHGHAGEELRKLRLLKELIADRPRSGTPCTYTPEQYTGIIALALKEPAEFNRPITHWTARELCDEVHLQEIAPGISPRQVKRFLDQADLQPHNMRYWMNPKIDDPDEYRQQVKVICDIYSQAIALHKAGSHLISTDEKTGIQALERIAPAKPMAPGKIERIEHEYKRHGTLCLIPSFEVATGKIVETYIGDTRNESDYANHLINTMKHDPDGEWIFINDQLNTHMSETIVRFVAERCEITGDLGIKGVSGILKSKATRKAFIEDTNHRIRMIYTPKHCSWLNQVEIWFGVLVKKVIKRGNFTSKEDLRTKLEAFIDYFNRTMARPYKWTYKGVPLTG